MGMKRYGVNVRDTAHQPKEKPEGIYKTEGLQRLQQAIHTYY